ncbi:uncharacterized protein LOC141895400 [Acropora palmata]|uniref:uncharacterized protein LOC141895400 n=1 Tax=Acropora palmata TaxID=6131 RepID=UPI003DA1A3E7
MTVGNLSNRRFLWGDGKRKLLSLPIQVSRQFSRPSRLHANAAPLSCGSVENAILILMPLILSLNSYFDENKSFTSNLIINTLFQDCLGESSIWIVAKLTFLMQPGRLNREPSWKSTADLQCLRGLHYCLGAFTMAT